jgi:alkylated DNA repair dioxygenase AlkB
LSLGAPRRFVLAARRGKERHALTLGHGDLCVMRGTCQRHFRHGIPRTREPVGERVSLTFRNLLRAPSTSP